MKIEVNVEKKYVFIILGAAILLAGAIFTAAVWSNPSSGAYHPASEVKVNIGGTDYSLQESVDTSKIVQIRVVCGDGSSTLINPPSFCPTGWTYAGTIDQGGSHDCWDKTTNSYRSEGDADDVLCYK